MKWTVFKRLSSFWARPRCACCDRLLHRSEAVFCSPCQMHLEPTGFEASPRDNAAMRLFFLRVPLDKAVSLYHFHSGNPVARAIYRMKYGRRPSIAVALGRMAARQLTPTGFFDGIDGIVPVPLTRWRRFTRGFNQSEKLALGVASVAPMAIEKRLVRRKVFARSQASQAGFQRGNDLFPAFAPCAGADAKGRRLLVIDDVVTTGATAMAVAKHLFALGAASVSLLTVAYTGEG